MLNNPIISPELAEFSLKGCHALFFKSKNERLLDFDLFSSMMAKLCDALRFPGSSPFVHLDKIKKGTTFPCS
jgi:hypothetical protein